MFYVNYKHFVQFLLFSSNFLYLAIFHRNLTSGNSFFINVHLSELYVSVDIFLCIFGLNTAIRIAKLETGHLNLRHKTNIFC